VGIRGLAPAASGPSRLEVEEQNEAMGLLRLCGAKVYSLSQRRRTGQTPGIPDVFAFVPLPSGVIVPLWLEVKRDDRRAKSSPEQVVFQLLCKLAEVHHVVGSVRQLEEWCVRHDLIALKPGGGWRMLHAQHNVLATRLAAFGPLFTSAGERALWSERRGLEAEKRSPRTGVASKGPKR